LQEDTELGKRQRKIAMLIDGDNASPNIIENMIRETEKYGTITVRQVYGDWTEQNMRGWKEILHVHAIQPIQQFRYTVGKNCTDSALIINAMDILHQKIVSGFCIVSSDSDYTRLATRIREAGYFVMGIGRKLTPESFVKACDVFVHTENISPEKTEIQDKVKKEEKKPISSEKAKNVPAQITSVKGTPQKIPVQLLLQAFDMVVREDGTAFLANMGNALLKIDSSFDPRTYGFKLLSPLISSSDLFIIKSIGEGPTKSIIVSLKERK
jgi:uncharacterized LabA/DUF88 family protein